MKNVFSLVAINESGSFIFLRFLHCPVNHIVNQHPLSALVVHGFVSFLALKAFKSLVNVFVILIIYLIIRSFHSVHMDHGNNVDVFESGL